MKALFVIATAAIAFPLLVLGDDAILPGNGFSPAHYETLWTKSPFAVATSEAPAESADYQLVGIAQFDGISYASLIDKQSQEHFLLGSDKPVRGLVLTSIDHGQGGSAPSAVIQRNGESITLKLDVAPPTAGPGLPSGPVAQIPMPGVQIMPQNNPLPGQVPPTVNFRRRMIHVPPPPGTP